MHRHDFYGYSNAKVSKFTFNNPFFRKLMSEEHVAGLKSNNDGSIMPKTCPRLNAKGLVSRVLEEENIHDLAMQLAFKLCYQF